MDNSQPREKVLCEYVKFVYRALDFPQEMLAHAKKLPEIRPHARCITVFYRDGNGKTAGGIRMSVDWCAFAFYQEKTPTLAVHAPEDFASESREWLRCVEESFDGLSARVHFTFDGEDNYADLSMERLYESFPCRLCYTSRILPELNLEVFTL